MEYRYWISYMYTAGTSWGVGAGGHLRFDALDAEYKVKEAQAQIAKAYKLKDVVIINWMLLSAEKQPIQL